MLSFFTSQHHYSKAFSWGFVLYDCPPFHIAICLPSTYTSPQGFAGCFFYFAVKQHIICDSTLVTFWRGLGALQDLCIF